jgi:hypothetical protein
MHEKPVDIFITKLFMEKKITYSEKLLDPRWQRKRLEILSRDNFTCQICQSTTKTLHVHHKKYEYGKDPWEVEDIFLITLCKDCHYNETKDFEENLKYLVEILRQNLSSSGLWSLIHAFGNTPFNHPPDLYAEVVDDVFHSDYIEEIIQRKSNGWSSVPEIGSSRPNSGNDDF